MKNYDELRLIPQGGKVPYKEFLKKNNLALFYWLNKARMEYVTDVVAETGKIVRKGIIRMYLSFHQTGLLQEFLGVGMMNTAGISGWLIGKMV